MYPTKNHRSLENNDTCKLETNLIFLRATNNMQNSSLTADVEILENSTAFPTSGTINIESVSGNSGKCKYFNSESNSSSLNDRPEKRTNTFKNH